ncbi:transcriptional regulator ATRX homolog isoform X2 [Drosophila gunungcola]|uniref:transcriptional regulator ATRX homolog isoform X2 n=1 Tax=Drosophila gunungcola TaxID=103775 RepID=UPI0022E76475|nr:transcriptional regulator ATRX homolog isoform X2 [Drosophila gunungcola]
MKTALPSQTSRGGSPHIVDLFTKKEHFDESFKSQTTVETKTINETAYEFQDNDIYPLNIKTNFKNHGDTEDLLSTQTKEIFCSAQTNFQTYKRKFVDALSDHNYTCQEVILCQPNSDIIREILLSAIIPSRNIIKDIPSDIYSFIENTIKNLKMYKYQYDAKQEKRFNPSKALSINIVNQTRKTKSIYQNCSETLEIDPNDQCLTNIYTNLGNQKVLNGLLASTMSFARQLFFECNTFASKSENELREFISKKLKKLEEILGRLPPTTDVNSENVLKNRYQHNFKAKMKLMLNTSGSSQTDSEFERSFDEICSESSNKSSKMFCLKQLICDSRENESHHQNFSDGIDLSKYIKLEIMIKPIVGVFNELNTKINSSISNNETDQEIKRLINLTALNKRHGNRTSVRSKYKGRLKAMERSMTQFVPDKEELDEYLSEQFNDNEKNIITEDKFLSRYNDQIKQLLLNDSSSDSGLSNLSNYDNLKESPLQDDGNSSGTVDKFLQVLKTNTIFQTSLQKVEKSKTKYISASETLDYNMPSVSLNISSLKIPSLDNDLDLRRKKNEIILSSESDSLDNEDGSEQKIRFIKPMLRIDQLAIETRSAQKNETERIRRLDKKNVVLSKAIKSNYTYLGNSDLILDYIESTKTFIKVNEDLVKLLKPHQRDGVRFMYDSCYGGIEVGKINAGSGCILAHCMGLGKTLQLIALLHTAISYKELNTSKILVLCPKSTVMNWADEFQQWLCGIKNDNRIKVFIFPDSSLQRAIGIPMFSLSGSRVTVVPCLANSSAIQWLQCFGDPGPILGIF